MFMSENPRLPAPAGGEFLIYDAADGRTRIEVRFSGETVWLSLNQMADLFQRDKSVISKHIKNVFEDQELAPEATVAKFATVQTEGGREVSREIEFFNLDVILSVGYRVKSLRGTQSCRNWAGGRFSLTRAVCRMSRRRPKRRRNLKNIAPWRRPSRGWGKRILPPPSNR